MQSFLTLNRKLRLFLLVFVCLQVKSVIVEANFRARRYNEITVTCTHTLLCYETGYQVMVSTGFMAAFSRSLTARTLESWVWISLRVWVYAAVSHLWLVISEAFLWPLCAGSLDTDCSDLWLKQNK
jgi:hypothetical protein